MKRTALLFLAGLAFLAAGCSTTERAGIAVRIAGATLSGAEVNGAEVTFTVRLANETVYPMAIERLACRIEFDGIDLGEAVAVETFGLPAQGAAVRSLSVRLPAGVADRVRAALARGDVPYRIRSRLTANEFGDLKVYQGETTGRYAPGA